MKFINNVEKKSIYAMMLKIPKVQNFRENDIFSVLGVVVFAIMLKEIQER